MLAHELEGSRPSDAPPQDVIIRQGMRKFDVRLSGVNSADHSGNELSDCGVARVAKCKIYHLEPCAQRGGGGGDKLRYKRAAPGVHQ